MLRCSNSAGHLSETSLYLKVRKENVTTNQFAGVLMKYLYLLSLFVSFTFNPTYASEVLEESVYYPVESLKNSAAKAYMIQVIKKQTVEEVLLHSIDIKELLVAQYLLSQGYVEVKSLTSGHKIYSKKNFVEQKTDFFLQTGSDDVDHYRPTRHKKNPFLRKSKKDGTPQFAYTIQEKGTRKSYCHDLLACISRPMDGYDWEAVNISVGPSKQNRFAYIGKYDSGYLKGLIIHKTWIWDKELVIDNEHEMMQVAQFNHIFRGDEGKSRGGGNNHFNEELRRWWRSYERKKPKLGIDWEGCERDDVTCVAMNPEKDIFYGGTRSGKLYWYYEYYDDYDQGPRGPYFWQYKQLSVNLKQPIDDMELSDDATFLWLLSNGSIYTYTFKSESLKLCLKLPEELIDEVEKISMIRTTPYVSSILIGGTQGTVYLIDTEDKNVYKLDSLDEKFPIEDMWWSEADQLVLLNRSGNIRYCTVCLVKPSTFFEKENVLSVYSSFESKV